MGFSSGEFSASILWQTLMFFLPVFYTDTFGLSAAAAGTMFLLVRLFDAINDPIMGTIADNTRTRWGQFRPYLLWLAVPFGIGAVLMFYVPDFAYTGKLLYAYITYTLMMVIYTAIMIPYNAMVGVITPDPGERTEISSYKFVFAYAAGITVQALVIPLVERFGGGNDIMGYRMTMILFGSISVIFFLIAFFSSRERVEAPKNQKFAFYKDLKNLLANKAWVIIFFVSLLLLIYVAIRSSVIIYYFQYLIGNRNGATAFMVTGTVFVLIGVLPTRWLSDKFGKKRLFITCMVIIGLSSIGLYFAESNLRLLYFFQIVFSLASGPTMPLIWSMLADSADYGEWKFGRRTTGLVYSAATFGQKAGFSIGGAIALWVLAFFGYQANVVQPEAALMGIKLSLSVIPGVLALGVAGILYFYPVNDEDVIKISMELNRKKNNV